jgi:hypothetical protein
MRLLEYLVNEIGPRWTGRPSNERAAAYLAAEFAELGLNVKRQSFPFIGWEIDAPPRLDVLSPEPYSAAVALMEYSGSTPATGVEGEVRPAGTAFIVPGFLEFPRYAIMDADGLPAAYLVVHEGLDEWHAPPIPLHVPDPMIAWPSAMISQDDHDRFRAWLEGGKSVRARLTTQSRIVSPLWAHNVIATLPGLSEETVLFCAHLDTAFGTAGANNNACGVQALYDLAERLAQEPSRPLTSQFLLCDGCEWQFIGSRHFVSELRSSGELGRYRAAINVDTVASGDSLYLLASTDDVRRRSELVVDQLRLRDRFRQVEYLGALAGSDHYSFLQAGVPASEILFWPCDTYKLAGDTSSAVDPALIATAVEIAAALARTYEDDLR